MISRSAYAQLGYSPVVLAGAVLGMVLVYFVPAMLALMGEGPARWLGLCVWLMMALSFQPMLRFYRDALGFEEQARMPSAAFLSAGGYHHHVGLNSWQSEGAGAPPDTAPGLRQVEFELGDSGGVDDLERRLAASAGEASTARRENRTFSVRDPDGQMLTFRAR